jgi:hypothetical protein
MDQICGCAVEVCSRRHQLGKSSIADHPYGILIRVWEYNASATEIVFS